MKFGMIGNCQYNALVDTKGAVQWLCWPRFDSSFVFGSLLDEFLGGYFSIGAPDGSEGLQSYLRNTNILKTEFSTKNGSFRVIDFAPRFYQYNRYYKPTMLVRIVEPLKGDPVARVVLNPTSDYGRLRLHPHFGSNHISYAPHLPEIRLTTNASLNLVAEGRPFVLDRRYFFVLTYGQPLEMDLPHTCDHFLEKTVDYWRTWVKHCAIPNQYQDEVIRSALVLKLHQFEDTGAIIASSTTSIPEAKGTVRNWDYRYCWLRDAQFSLSALNRLTQFEEMEAFVGYLRNIVEAADSKEGRLQPVYGISGEPYLKEIILDHLKGYDGHKPVRIGNQAHEHLQHDVYGEMILAISQLFLDRRFAAEQYQPPLDLLNQLLRQISKYIDSKDAGLWEFRGISQCHSFTCLMHWVGASMAIKIGSTFRDQNLMDRAQLLQQQCVKNMEKKFWNSKLGAYTQAEQQQHLDASLLMMVNLGYLQPNNPKALSHVKAIAQQLAAPNGFLRRYICEDDFGQTENAFIICSFWLAEAYARLGQKEKALSLFTNLLSRSNHLGLYSEDMNPTTYEMWGNFPQTYSHVGLINAAFAIANHSSPL